MLNVLVLTQFNLDHRVQHKSNSGDKICHQIYHRVT